MKFMMGVIFWKQLSKKMNQFGVWYGATMISEQWHKSGTNKEEKNRGKKETTFQIMWVTKANNSMWNKTKQNMQVPVNGLKCGKHGQFTAHLQSTFKMTMSWFSFYTWAQTINQIGRNDGTNAFMTRCVHFFVGMFTFSGSIPKSTYTALSH